MRRPERSSRRAPFRARGLHEVSAFERISLGVLSPALREEEGPDEGRRKGEDEDDVDELEDFWQRRLHGEGDEVEEAAEEARDAVRKKR
jgi:hypothetical protein